MFASAITKNVSVGDVTITIRKLSWKKLKEAAQANSDSALATASKLSPEMLKAFREMDERQIASAQSSAQDRYKGYDREKVLNSGIVSWTATTKLSADAIADLEEDVAEQVYRAVIDLSIPPKEVAEAHRGEP